MDRPSRLQFGFSPKNQTNPPEQQALRLDADIRPSPALLATGGTIATQKIGDTRILPLGLFSQNEKLNQNFIFKNPVDSSNITRGLQSQLTTQVIRTYQCSIEQVSAGYKRPPGIVITHGTDTLAEDAALLAYQKMPIPIVLTGSWASKDEKGSDAEQNLRQSLILVSKMPYPGVFVVIQGIIHLATHLKKTNTAPRKPLAAEVSPYPSARINSDPEKHYSYFVSLDDCPVGYFDGQDTPYLYAGWDKFLRQQQKMLEKLPPGKIEAIHPAYVEHIVMTKEMPADVFLDLVKRLRAKKEPCGAVIEGDIVHHRDYRAFHKIIDKLEKKGIYILIATAPKKGSSSNHFVDSIPPIQLRAKLAALLGNKKPGGSLLQAIQSDDAGEVVRPEDAGRGLLKLPSKFSQNAELVIATPSLDSPIIDDAVKRLKRRKLSHPLLLIVGYGDGHIPIGPGNMRERLITGFQKTDPEIGRRLIETIDAETEPTYTISHIHHHLIPLSGSAASADKKLRTALMNSHPVLLSIGQAIDNGIQVKMATNAEYAAPNLQAYEIGTILKAIGMQEIKIQDKPCPTGMYLNSFADEKTPKREHKQGYSVFLQMISRLRMLFMRAGLFF